MIERNAYWENQIKAFKQFQREIEGSTSSTAHTTYWLTGWNMGVKENQKKIADLEDDLNAAIDEVKDKDKRIAELKTSITGIPRYSMAGIGLHFPNDAEECVWINITEIESVLSEGGADE